MKIILIRHGDAGAYSYPDNERNLSDLGRSQAGQTADWLRQNYQPSEFISSPYNRAKQTCDIVHQNFADIPLQIYEHITPNDDAKNAIAGLSYIIDNLPNAACVVIVCHMNIIAHIASILTGNPPEGFNLAEARVFESEIFAPDLAVEVGRFAPKI